ncbi:MAG: hypothetical protein HC786_22920 [Richelia sp. CSU_2_1]|nr:hypothetical protein [Richelia sp. CSU_2_1]
MYNHFTDTSNCQLSTVNEEGGTGHPLRFASPLPVNCQLSTVNYLKCLAIDMS